MSSNNNTELVQAVVTALAQLEISKRHAQRAAQDADKIEPTVHSGWDRCLAFGELMAVIEARRVIGVALIKSGVSLDSIREIEANVHQSAVLA